MIRINLSPSLKRKVQQPGRANATALALPSTKVSRGGIYAIAMLLGWVALGGVAYMVTTGVTEDTARIAAQTAALAKETKDINDKIDEEGLQARKSLGEEQTIAVDALEEKRRTPVYVYHEITNILTTGRMPTVNQLEQNKLIYIDDQARLDINWEANAVWIKSMAETENGVLEITGGTRDPDDLSEFVKRLRASTRFVRISHPEFELEEVDPEKVTASSAKKPIKPGESNMNYYNFELTAQVRYWD
jgi:Tfp pilus assembly protein PilN